MIKVLLAVGISQLTDQVADVLSPRDFRLTTVGDTVTALQTWRRDDPDVVLADISSHAVDGFALCETIRRGSETPVILLAAKPCEDEMIRGYAVGADDFVAQPVAAYHLALRIRAVHGRYAARRSANHRKRTDGPRTGIVSVGDLTLDLDLHQVSYGTTAISLTPMEFRIIHVLAVNSGSVIPHARLMEHVWGYAHGNHTALRSRVAQLRRKLRSLVPTAPAIEVIPGSGYFLAQTTSPQRPSLDQASRRSTALLGSRHLVSADSF